MKSSDILYPLIILGIILGLMALCLYVYDWVPQKVSDLLLREDYNPLNVIELPGNSMITFYHGTLIHSGNIGRVWSFSNATSFVPSYTGRDDRDRAQFNITLCGEDRCQNYTEITAWTVNSATVLRSLS